MNAERIDGMNPLAVIDAYRRKRKVIEDRKGPVLLDVVTYRISGHSPSDSSSYRTKEEIAMWAVSYTHLDVYKRQKQLRSYSIWQELFLVWNT